MPSAAPPVEPAEPVRRRKRAAPAAAGPTPAQVAIAPPTLQERLREALPATVDCLRRRRADLIDESLIEGYVNLQWMEWHGGGLRLTVTGQNICAQLAARGR